MKWISRTWRGFTGSEKLVVAAAGLALAGTFIFAAIGLVQRPGDISTPTAAFPARPAGARVPAGRHVDWLRYGYDPERTKFLNAQKVKPPYRKAWKYKGDQLIEFAPIISGKRLFVADNDGLYTAINVDSGKKIWSKRLATLNASSPAFSNGTLYAVSLEPPQAMAIRANTGKVVWQKDLPARAESSPMVIRGRMYFGTESGAFYALNTHNGKTIWETQLAGSVKAAPAFSDGTLYVGDYAGQMYAIRASDGAIVWHTSDLGVGLGRSGRFYSTPAVAFGRVYAGDVDQRVYSFDQKTGEIAWTFSAGGYVYSGIAAADTKGTPPSVYFGSHDRYAYALDAQSGELRWKELPGGQVSGPATAIGDVVYLSTFSGNSTVGFDLGTGRRVFKFDDGEYGPVVSDGEKLYLVGGTDIVAFKPVKIGDYKTKPGEKGIVPPAELRNARQASGGGGGSQAGSGQAAVGGTKAGAGKDQGAGGKKRGNGAGGGSGGGSKARKASGKGTGGGRKGGGGSKARKAGG